MNMLPLSPNDMPTFASGDFRELGRPFGLEPSNLAPLSPLLVQISKAYADLYPSTRAVAPWLGYLAISSDTGEIVGSCGYKANPQDGNVEIAYFTFPDYESRGWGGRMASALVNLALSRDEIAAIRAHTLREDNASTRILRRLGFTLQGTIIDPEDGPVWRWSLSRD
ncbi:MAG: GNAT family N-acetyltransferase [Hyphomicrobium sp.]|uniref:GNAT family N-acetyltransferase n=1 Tax=Hyphomicrobium sp. TaxID=82 RepID=UPI003D0F4291